MRRVIPKNRIVTVPKQRQESDYFYWRMKAFRKIIEMCKFKHIDDDEVFWFDFKDVIRYDRPVTEYDCKKPFTVKEMKHLVRVYDSMHEPK